MNLELDYNSFKTDINLTQYCASIGYEIVKNKTTKTSIAMKFGNDKVINSSVNLILTHSTPSPQP